MSSFQVRIWVVDLPVDSEVQLKFVMPAFLCYCRMLVRSSQHVSNYFFHKTWKALGLEEWFTANILLYLNVGRH